MKYSRWINYKINNKNLVNYKNLIFFIIILFLLFSFNFLLKYGFGADASSSERSSPAQRIAINDFILLQNGTFLLTKYQGDKITFSSFSDTNSMDPFLDAGAIGMEIKPKAATDIHIGDVISYIPLNYELNYDIPLNYNDDNHNGYSNYGIIHRVIAIEKDDFGIYYRLKGDNNFFADKEKVRFEQIKGVIVGVFY